MKRSLLILAALLGLSEPALSQPRPIPQGEIRSNGDITFGNALKLGKREGDKTVITPDTLRILGPGSTGPADDFDVTLSDGVKRSLTTAITALRGDFSTLAEFKAARAPFGRNFATVGGCATVGDGGAARYRRLTAAPSSPKLWQVQIADGSWWEMMGDDVDVRQLCAMGGPWSTPVSSLPNDYTKLQAAIDYVGLTGGRVRLPGGLRFRTDTGLVARVERQTAPAPAGSNLLFKDNSTFNLISDGGGAVAAGTAMKAVLTIRYNENLTGNLAPFMTKVEGWTIEGNGLAENSLFSDYMMHLNLTRNRLFGGTNSGVKFLGYGVARIWGNVFNAPRCIDMQEGGGDSWIGPNDYYPTANGSGVSIGTGNLNIENGVFNGEGLPGIIGVDIKSLNNTSQIRHVNIRGNEFSGMNYAVRAEKSTTTRNIYGLTISENHVTPAAGGAVHTGILAHLTGVDEAIITNNMGNSSRQVEATSNMILAFDSTNLQIIGNRAGNYRGAWLYFNFVRRSMIALNNVQDVGRSGPDRVIVDLDNASEGNDFLDNTIRQTSASFSQNGLFERAGSTGNYGRNRLIGVATPSTLASGSTSSFTAR